MSPVAPGTAGSLAATVVLLLIYRGIAPSWVDWNLVLAAGIVAGSVAAVALGPWAFGYYGRKDPGSFVVDEVAGICLTTLGTPMRAGWSEAWVLLVTFAAFRIFDVWKPWPCRRLEMLPGGWGILADDLGAAIYANLLSQVVLRVVFKV